MGLLSKSHTQDNETFRIGEKMSKKNKGKTRLSPKKKTSIGSGKYTKWKHSGPNGGNKGYRKRPRGQGK